MYNFYLSVKFGVVASYVLHLSKLRRENWSCVDMIFVDWPIQEWCVWGT